MVGTSHKTGDFMVILWWFYGDLINGDLMMI